MRIAVHQIEPWLIKHQFVRFNLGESGMVNQSVGELLEAAGSSVAELSGVMLHNYDTRGSLALREAIAALYDGVKPENVLVTTGTSEALMLYYLVRQEAGKNVVIPTPAFQSLDEIPRYLGYEVRELALRPEAEFRMDLDALAGLIDANTASVVVNNPQNPTGTRLTADEERRLFALAKKTGVELLADEHYRFVPYGEEELIPSLYRPDSGVVAVGSMIKCFGCVGLRVGWLLGPAELLDACRDLKDYTTHTVSGLCDEIATRALVGWRKIMPRYRGWLAENLQALTGFMERHHELFGWVPPQGGLVCFPFLKDPSIRSSDFALRLVEQTEVFLLPGETFNRPGHFRVGLGLEPQEFREALSRWSDFIDRRGWRS